ncbi:Zn-dependent hydrolase [Alicyclobacillus sp. SO9]|uniref:Zn-dependent hydrolase n=1 Tax=Alicyclobacillus sp. SO9 TaxID=2665646 RepID=UPI0018E8D3B5|nr:Zn-dependent hydrolase [Alicyclobacillus sp. SO9]QQE77124.1 Zn-dependent hydrolase [Alicyclobacillus sp. SO9]
MTLNADRLWHRLKALHEYGQSPDGGVNRFSFTDEERAVKNQVSKYMRAAGLEVREDAVGNLVGRLEGTDPAASVILVGSHVDSVPNGGDFDGPLGVLSGIEAVQAMQEEGHKNRHPIEVVAFTDEEGSRFHFGMIGSRAAAGTLRPEDFDRTDNNGTSIAEAMKAQGFNPEGFLDAARKPGSVRAYLEVHIEQGKVLELRNEPVGVVTGIAGPVWLQVRVYGEAGHAGATPMNLRKDALVGASEMIQFIEEETSRHPRTVGTVGQLRVSPGGVNIIPGDVEFTLDLRDIDVAQRDAAETAIRAYIRKVCTERGLKSEIKELQRIQPVQCDETVQILMSEAAKEAGFTAPFLPSGAGHDGMQLAVLCPIGMIFARSKDGISHHPDEYTSKEDCAAAAQVLYRTLKKLS